MGLRCLLGHDFTGPEVEREREEDGEEVVTTVREVKTCRRCGEAQVVSENTEVTTMEQLTDQATGADPATGDGPEPSPDAVRAADAGRGTDDDTVGTTKVDTAGTPSQSDDSARRSGPNTGALDDADGDDAEILDDGPTPTTGGDGPTGAAAEGAASGGSETSDVAGEDAEILDAGDAAESGESGSAGDNGESEYAADADREPVGTVDESTDDGERGRGAWPAVDEVADESGPEPGDWPEHREDDEGFSAEVGGDGGDGGVEFGGGLTPESADPPAEVGPETEYVEAPGRGDGTAAGPTSATGDGDDGPAADTGSEITRDETPEFEHMTSSAPTEYYCPECGMSEHAGGNSMRAGDVCPECKGGYVAERRR